MADPLTDMRQLLDRHRKTILCPPELVETCRELIDQHSPTPGLWDVQPSEHTGGHVYVIDHVHVRLEAGRG